MEADVPYGTWRWGRIKACMQGRNHYACREVEKIQQHIHKVHSTNYDPSTYSIIYTVHNIHVLTVNIDTGCTAFYWRDLFFFYDWRHPLSLYQSTAQYPAEWFKLHAMMPFNCAPSMSEILASLPIALASLPIALSNYATSEGPLDVPCHTWSSLQRKKQHMLREGHGSDSASGANDGSTRFQIWISFLKGLRSIGDKGKGWDSLVESQVKTMIEYSQ